MLKIKLLHIEQITIPNITTSTIPNPTTTTVILPVKTTAIETFEARQKAEKIKALEMSIVHLNHSLPHLYLFFWVKQVKELHDRQEVS